jgi:hypothetical protein
MPAATASRTAAWTSWWRSGSAARNTSTSNSRPITEAVARISCAAGESWPTRRMMISSSPFGSRSSDTGDHSHRPPVCRMCPSSCMARTSCAMKSGLPSVWR